MGEERFLRGVLGVLDDTAAHLDAATLAKLHAARNRAVARAVRPRWGRLGLGATALAAASLATLFVLGGRPAAVQPNLLASDDLELIVSVDDIEQFEELEFYGWLATYADAS